jgi:transmembrane E3 ubiquitin-protein ligase
MICVLLFQRYPWVLVFLLYSFWVPQIVHSVRTGIKKPLLDYYYIGTGLCRLYIPLYILGCPDNIFSRIDADFKASFPSEIILIVWTFTQLSILYMQNTYGPRYLIPRSWFPDRYDYCRPIQHTAAGAGATCNRECTICYMDVDVSKREYMVTPCDHLFHQACLNQWIDIKLECPVCRSTLPASD